MIFCRWYFYTFILKFCVCRLLIVCETSASAMYDIMWKMHSVTFITFSTKQSMEIDRKVIKNFMKYWEKNMIWKDFFSIYWLEWCFFFLKFSPLAFCFLKQKNVQISYFLLDLIYSMKCGIKFCLCFMLCFLFDNISSFCIEQDSENHCWQIKYVIIYMYINSLSSFSLILLSKSWFLHYYLHLSILKI